MLKTGLPGAGQDQRRSTSSATPRSRLKRTIGAFSEIRTSRGCRLGMPSGKGQRNLDIGEKAADRVGVLLDPVKIAHG